MNEPRLFRPQEPAGQQDVAVELGKRTRKSSGAGAAGRPAKRRKEDPREKIERYSLLAAFFRVYLQADPSSAVLKDAIYGLYELQVPAGMRMARNALYRCMWSSFAKGSIQVQQSNYRDFIKGLKMRTSELECTYELFASDRQLLASHGITDLFAFDEQELVELSISSKAKASQAVRQEADGDVEAALDRLAGMAEELVKGIADLRAVVATQQSKKQTDH